MSETIKELRKASSLTQKELAELINMPLRTYKVYENDPGKVGTIKYNYILDILAKVLLVDETHGLLNIDKISEICRTVFQEYDVKYCYLFGSYAKGTQKESSDVDLLITTNTTGLEYYGLVEKLRTQLKKKVDLLDFNQVINNPDLLNEILSNGVKIYG